MKKILVLCLSALSIYLPAQDFIFGHDLSYVNQMEDCGAVFKEGGIPKDVFSIFADHGANLVRVRMWVDPSWWQDSLSQPEGVKPHYNDLEDVKKTIRRARNAGMQVMLGMHYSDFWADPGLQLIPRAWLDVAYSLEDLKDSVYEYTFRVLSELDGEGLMPDFVKVGNETNGGILRHIPEENGFDPVASVSSSWARHAQLFNAAIAAVREVGENASVNPRVVLHFSNELSGQVWNYNNIISNGVTDFDVIGISYYYAWSGGSIGELESTIADLATTFPEYEVMVVETGYPWTTENFDALGNIIEDPDPAYLPVIPEKQLEYLVDYTRAVMRGGGTGVIFWEPAWVSTPCTTPWGKGSSQDHVVFFDPVNNNFMENGGGGWSNSDFYTDLETNKVNIMVNMTGADTSTGVYIRGNWNKDSLELIPMASEGNGIYSYFTYLPSGFQGIFSILNDTSGQTYEPVPEACRSSVPGSRSFHVGRDDTIISFHWASCEPLIPPSQVRVTFRVQMNEDSDVSNGVYVTGDINNWEISSMEFEGNRIYGKSFMLPPGDDLLAYYYLTTNTWDNYSDYRESVPRECALKWNTDRAIAVPPRDTTVGHRWGSCLTIEEGLSEQEISSSDNRAYLVYPNPASGNCQIQMPDAERNIRFWLYCSDGALIFEDLIQNHTSEINMNLSDLAEGLYYFKLQHDETTVVKKIIVRR